MKSIYLINALLVSMIASYAQNSGRIGYQMILEINKNKMELSQLVFEGHRSVFTLSDTEKKMTFSDGEFSLNSEDGVSNELGLSFSMGADFYLPYIYIDLAKKQILSKTYLPHNGETEYFICTEETNSIRWNLQDEMKTLGRFECQKATTAFRGRNYTVWYTYEIPVPLGPWKLHGLPGLILEAYDEEAGVQFLYHSVEIPYTGDLIPLPPEGGKLISIREYADIEATKVIELTRAIESKLPRGATIAISSIGESLAIEREFE